jgi:hypothetical protein
MDCEGRDVPLLGYGQTTDGWFLDSIPYWPPRGQHFDAGLAKPWMADDLHFREEPQAVILVEDDAGPGWGPPVREGASVFQATFNMVSNAAPCAAAQ